MSPAQKSKLFYSTFSKLSALWGIIILYVIFTYLPNSLAIFIASFFILIICFNYTVTIIDISKQSIKTIYVTLIPVKINEEKFEDFNKVILKPFNRYYAVARAWNIFLERKNGDLQLVSYGYMRTRTIERVQKISEILSLPYKIFK